MGLGSAAVAVEVFAWGERHPDSGFTRMMRRPGYEIQRVIGTREPTPEQLEVGRAALAEILRVEGAEARPRHGHRGRKPDAADPESSGFRSRGSARAITRTRTSTSPGSCSRDRTPPAVTMQVFQKHHSVLGGIDEAIAMLKLCSDDWSDLEVHALHEGDEIAPLETVLPIEGDYALFAHLETVYLGWLARRTRSCATCARWWRRRAASRSCSSPLATTTGSCRPATAGPRTWPARSASPPTPRRRGGAGAAWAPCRTG